MATYTITKRDGRKVTVNTDDRRRTVVSSAGVVNKSKRTYDSKGKLTIGAKSQNEINLELEQLRQAEAEAVAIEKAKNQGYESEELGMSVAGQEDLKQSVARPSDLRGDAPMSYARQSDLQNQSYARFSDLVQDPKERAVAVSQAFNNRIPNRTQNYAPSVVDRDFYTFEGQGRAIVRGSVALAQAETDIANTVIQTVTLGKYKPFEEKEFTAETRITGEKAGYLLEKGANNPLTTASIIAGGVGLVRGGASLVAGQGLRASIGTATGTIGGKGIAGTLIRGANTLVASTGARGGTELIIDSVRLTNDEARIMRSDEFKEAQSVAFQRQKSEGSFGAYNFNVGNTNFSGSLEKIGQEVTLFSPTTKSYDSYLREELTNRGFTGDELELGVRAGRKARTSKGYGELAGLITLSAGSEVTGRFTQKSFANYVQGKGVSLAGSFGKSATVTGLAVAPAGFFEGYGQQLIQQKARSEKSDYGEAIKYGIVGSATALTLGGLIGGSANSGRKGLERGSKIVAYTTDPYEKIGDYTADAFQKTIGRGSRTVYLNANTITLTPSFTNTPTNTNTPSKSRGNIVLNPSFIPSFTNTPTNTNAFVEVPTPTIEIEPTFSLSNSQNIVDTPSDTTNPVDTPPESYSLTDNSVFTDTTNNVFTNTPTNTDVFTNTNTNVFTTNLKLPPLPIVLGGGGGSGSGGRGSRGRRKVKQTKKPSSLIGLTFGWGAKNVGQTFSGLGVRR